MQLVDQKSEHYMDEIVEANKQKLIAQYRKVYQGLVDMMAQQQRDIDRLKERLIRFDVDMNMSFEETIRAIRNRLTYVHTKVFDDLKREVSKELDKDCNRDDSINEIQRCATALFKAYTRESKIIVEYEFSRLEEKIRERRRELDNIQIGGLHIDISSLEMPDLDEAFGKMDLNFGDFVDLATTVGGTALAFSVVPGIGTLTGAVIGTALYFGKQFFLGDGKRNEAKLKALELIDQKKRESQSTSLNKQINAIEQMLDREKDRFQQIIRNERNNLQQLSDAIEDAQRQVVAYANHIKNTAYGEI